MYNCRFDGDSFDLLKKAQLSAERLLKMTNSSVPHRMLKSISAMRHAVIVGVIGLVLSITGAAGTLNKGPEFGPRWYPLGLVVTALPCAWRGGRLYISTPQSHVQEA